MFQRILSVVVLSFIIGFAIFYWQYQQQINLNTQSLIAFSRVVSAAINPDRVESVIKNPTDTSNPDYLRLKEQLSLVAASGQNVQYVYLMSYNNSGVYFITDAQPEATDASTLAKLGEVYSDADENIYDVLFGRKPMTISSGSDKWGSFISSALPIYSRDKNNIIAMVGVDINQDVWYQTIWRGMIPTIMLIISLFLAEIVLILNYLKNIQNRKYLLFLASILSSSADAIIGLDFDGTIKTWNHGAETIYGYTPLEMVGKNIRIIVPRDKHWEIDNYISQAKISHSVFIPSTTRIDKRKNIITITLTISPVVDNNHEVIGLSIISRDISQIVKSEQELLSRNQDLEKMNQLLVGRELQMATLKSQLHRLQKGGTS
jgi:PAS domain S-box-containing protein